MRCAFYGEALEARKALCAFDNVNQPEKLLAVRGADPFTIRDRANLLFLDGMRGQRTPSRAFLVLSIL